MADVDPRGTGEGDLDVAAGGGGEAGGEVVADWSEPERYRALPERSTAWLYQLGGGVLLLLGVVLGLIVLVAESELDSSDLPYNRWFFTTARAHPALAQFAADAQVGGSVVVASAVGLCFGIVLVALRRWRWLAFFVTSAVGGAIISEVVKNVVQRQRPVWPDPFFIEKGFSYPSGHTLSGITMWVAMGVVLLFILPKPWSTVLGFAVMLFGVLLGPSRWLYGVHWISDVVGGWLFGLGWLLLVTGIYLRRWGTSDGTRAIT